MPYFHGNYTIMIHQSQKNQKVFHHFIFSSLILKICKFTGCPPKLFPLLFFEFLGFLVVQIFYLGHFSTALSMQILKISILLLFGQILTEILPKYYKEVISKVNIFHLFLNQELDHSGSLRSTHGHSIAPICNPEH